MSPCKMVCHSLKPIALNSRQKILGLIRLPMGDIPHANKLAPSIIFEASVQDALQPISYNNLCFSIHSFVYGGYHCASYFLLPGGFTIVIAAKPTSKVW